MVYITRVKYYNDITSDSSYRDCFVVADSYTEAAEQMINYYGEDVIEKLYIEIFSPNNFLEFTEDDSVLFGQVKGTLSERIIW